MLRTRSRKPGASMTSSTALPTAIASGLPPKVEPCVPAVMPLAGFRRGKTGADRKAAAERLGERHDVRRRRRRADRRTARRCGPCRSAPRRRSAAGRARRRARAARAGTVGGTTRTPPSPCTGSIRIAAVSRPDRASSPPRDRRTAPGRSRRPAGRSLRDISCCRPAASVASVRPWKAPSKVMIR